MRHIKEFNEFINEFGPMYAPIRGSQNIKSKRVSDDLSYLKKGDKVSAIRNTNQFFNKGDKIEILDIKTNKDLGYIGKKDDPVFFVKINGKLKTDKTPFEILPGEMSLALNEHLIIEEEQENLKDKYKIGDKLYIYIRRAKDDSGVSAGRGIVGKKEYITPVIFKGLVYNDYKFQADFMDGRHVSLPLSSWDIVDDETLKKYHIK